MTWRAGMTLSCLLCDVVEAGQGVGFGACGVEFEGTLHGVSAGAEGDSEGHSDHDVVGDEG